MNVAGKNILVTGANTGIGRVTAVELAKLGAHVILACRSAEKTAPVVDELRAAGGSGEFLELDLASLESVRRAADAYLATKKPLHQLINNAGLAAPGLTKDGFELTFGVNHLGHYLLTRLLLPRLEEADAPRIVNVSSGSHYQTKTLDLDIVRKSSSVTALHEYAVSKLANVMFTKELARRHPRVLSTSLHPGVVASDAWRRIPWGFRHLAKLFMITTEDGAKTTLHCATADDLRNGAYYDRSRERKPNVAADDEQVARTLWDRSAEWVGLS